MSKSRSIFDIDDGESEISSEPPAKTHRIEQKQYEPNTNEPQLFDNGFDDLDVSSLEAEYTKEHTSQTKSDDSVAIDDNVLKAQQKARAEKNRQKALSLKNAKLVTRPVSDKRPGKCFLTGETLESQSSSLSQEKKTIDTGAGFFIDEEDEPERKVTEDPAPLLPDEDGRPRCEECSEELLGDSYLFKTFDLEVCDKCKDTSKDGKHELITKTDAKNTFLLKDGDFDRRDPPLKFIVRKNPHNDRWGDMKLFLRLQVEKRALEVWKTPEALEEEIEKKEDRRELVKAKKFGKRIKELRMQMRGSLFAKDYKTAIGVGHEHQFEDEIYDEDKDEYSRKCTVCGHINTYEKM